MNSLPNDIFSLLLSYFPYPKEIRPLHLISKEFSRKVYELLPLILDPPKKHTDMLSERYIKAKIQTTKLRCMAPQCEEELFKSTLVCSSHENMIHVLTLRNINRDLRIDMICHMIQMRGFDNFIFILDQNDYIVFLGKQPYDNVDPLSSEEVKRIEGCGHKYSHCEKERKEDTTTSAVFYCRCEHLIPVSETQGVFHLCESQVLFNIISSSRCRKHLLEPLIDRKEKIVTRKRSLRDSSNSSRILIREDLYVVYEGPLEGYVLVCRDGLISCIGKVGIKDGLSSLEEEEKIFIQTHGMNVSEIVINLSLPTKGFMGPF